MLDENRKRLHPACLSSSAVQKATVGRHQLRIFAEELKVQLDIPLSLYDSVLQLITHQVIDIKQTIFSIQVGKKICHYNQKIESD